MSPKRPDFGKYHDLEYHTVEQNIPRSTQAPGTIIARKVKVAEKCSKAKRKLVAVRSDWNGSHVLEHGDIKNRVSRDGSGKASHTSAA